MSDFLNENSSKKDVENFMNNNLTDAQKAQIKDVLADREKLNKILSSPLARELMRKFKANE